MTRLFLNLVWHRAGITPGTWRLNWSFSHAPNEREEIAQKLFKLTGQSNRLCTRKASVSWSELWDWWTEKFCNQWILNDFLFNRFDWWAEVATNAITSMGNFFSIFKSFLKSWITACGQWLMTERGFKLITNFIHTTHDEGQKQALLQVVEDHRKIYKRFDKALL